MVKYDNNNKTTWHWKDVLLADAELKLCQLADFLCMKAKPKP